MARTRTPKPTLSAPQNNSLAESAMLVNLTIRAWQGKKADKRATRELHAAHEASSKAGEYRKRLLGECGPLKDVHSIVAEANMRHRALTLPWMDEGTRILAAVGFEDYQSEMNGHKVRFEVAVRKFLKEYPELQMAARKDLGTLFLTEDYPTVQKLTGRFGFTWVLMPLPLATDFRVNLREEEAANIREQYEANTQDFYRSAMNDVYQRISKVLGHMIERLQTYRVVEDEERGAIRIEGKFHHTLVSNVSELIDVLPRLNIAQDRNMTEIAERMRNELLTYSAQELRDSSKRRKETATKAQAILKSVQQWAA